jgi:alkanesulfonate monooxygenase SsuD/methylene tetrahydromethanopterin reductase-like flavin-dependent oxidoreductase (luciferase family)
LSTNIAVAFARNPMIVANVGWDLQAYSEGGFILGLGTQIRRHVEKRFKQIASCRSYSRLRRPVRVPL